MVLLPKIEAKSGQLSFFVSERTLTLRPGGWLSPGRNPGYVPVRQPPQPRSISERLPD